MGFVLTERDFDAYAQSKWKSNAFNRERLEVKEKLVAFGRRIAPSLTAGDGSPLDCEATAEHPALWNHKQVDAQRLRFARGHPTRAQLDAILDRRRPLALTVADPAPGQAHAAMAVTIDFSHLSAAVTVHGDAAIDRDNLNRKLATTGARDALASRCRDAGHLEIAAAGQAARACESLTAADWDALCDVLARGDHHHTWLSIGRRWARAEAIALGDRTETELSATLAALLPIYQLIAWTPQNDHLDLAEVLRERATGKPPRDLVRGDRVRITTGMFAGRPGLVVDIGVKGAVKVLVGKIPIKIRIDEVEKT